eukprot:TRINITY_DN9709_c0_g1_i1.p1 TRINITY_DN9709_c0_g1~~TRINITY_DN9709_c0_g1_i1.p1  ORF type:complete len:199 (+),score=54.59 TRINITY_DN9709_c0_g1_i1:53-649(+)
MALRKTLPMFVFDSTLGKALMPFGKFQFAEWRMRRKSRLLLLGLAGIMGGAMAYTSYTKMYAVDASERLKFMIGWTGEYAQDFTVPGQPPFNLNLPPHLRCDMKSYLDLPETVLPPPPAWDALHPYLQDRYTDLFLHPAWYTREKQEDKGRGWLYIAPWGGCPDLEITDTFLSKDRTLERAEDGVLFSNTAPSKGKDA